MVERRLRQRRIHARFENGVLVYDDFAAMSEGSDGNAVYTLNGESIDEAAFSAFLDEQAAKDDLAWTGFLSMRWTPHWRGEYFPALHRGGE